ncbi:MAG: hypothetical protein KGQ83_07530, partial [Planctomycetes bacterium]|nr:hypothetical protein [Planctomycetota bacterium]
VSLKHLQVYCHCERQRSNLKYYHCKRLLRHSVPRNDILHCIPFPETIYYALFILILQDSQPNYDRMLYSGQGNYHTTGASHRLTLMVLFCRDDGIKHLRQQCEKFQDINSH